MMAVDAAGERIRFVAGLMDGKLSDYEAQRADLAQLVCGVESVIDSLVEVADTACVSEIRKLWGTLEIVYDVNLDGGRPALTDDERRDVGETILTLRSLLESADPPPSWPRLRGAVPNA